MSRAHRCRSSPRPGHGDAMTTFALMFLLARAFSSGCAALTGVEAISNGVPAFRKPKSRTPPRPCCCSASIAITMMLSIIVLAKQMGLKLVDPLDFDRMTFADGSAVPADFHQPAAIAQIAEAVFNDFTPGFYFVVTVTGIILVLAANTAFNGFPVLGSILAQDGFAPRALGCARRPARLQQRHRVPRGDGDHPDPGVRCPDDQADPALHRRGLRVLQPQPAGDDPPLDPAPEGRVRSRRLGAGCCAPG